MTNLGEVLDLEVPCVSMTTLPWGTCVLVRGGSRDVVVPKWAISEACIKAMFSPRNQDTFQIIVRTVKEMCHQKKIPLVERPDIIMYASVLGFIATYE